MPALGVKLPGSTVGIARRLSLSFDFSSGAPGVSGMKSLWGVSLVFSGVVVSYAEDSGSSGCMARVSHDSSAGVLVLSLPVPGDIRGSLSSYGTLEVAFGISPVSESSVLEEAFFWFLVFLLTFARRASTSEVSPSFGMFLVFLRIEEATGTSASDGGAFDLALDGMMS